MENRSDEIELLFGLESYCEFMKKEPARVFTHEMINILRSDDVKKSLLNFCLKNVDKMTLGGDPIFSSVRSYKNKNDDMQLIKDGLSRSQVKSKIWLIQELSKIKANYDDIVIMAGWFGQLVNFIENTFDFSRIRILEIDKQLCESSDYIFNLRFLHNHQVKSVLADINKLVLHKNGYEWTVENFKDNTSYDEKFLPDLIINTSAEHMTEEWFHQIRFKELESDPIVAIQSNNMFEGDGHVNCVHSSSHLQKKFPMREILFEGELQLKGYKRVMLIGKP
jgi:hypothetical protein